MGVSGRVVGGCDVAIPHGVGEGDASSTGNGHLRKDQPKTIGATGTVGHKVDKKTVAGCLQGCWASGATVVAELVATVGSIAKRRRCG